MEIAHMKFTHKLIALVATGLVLSGAAMAQNPSRLQLQDADGDRGILSVGTLTATRTFTFPDESGSLLVGVAGSKTLPTGTANNNTARWNSATSTWDETSLLTVGTDGDIVLTAVVDLGAGDMGGGYLRIRQTTGSATNADVLLQAEGTGDAIAELRLGYNGDDGDFRLYSKNAATDELALTTASGVLTMGSVNNAITIGAFTDGDILVGTATHYLQVDGFASAGGGPFVKLVSTDIQLDGPATVTGALTSHAVNYDIALGGANATVTLTGDSHVVIIDDATTTTVELPAGTTGRALIIKNQSGAAIDIDPNGTETINGGAAGAVMALADGAATHIVYSGGNWYVVGP